MMIVSFKSKSTEDIFNGESTKEARRTCPKDLWKVAVRKLDQLNAVTNLSDLKVPPGNFLEALLGNQKGQYSIWINQQYRICFIWTDAGPEQIEILDYH